eukprot:2014631-Prymnesium_polylepis.1
MPSRAALGKAPPANAAKPSAPSNSTESPAPTLADRELQIFNDAGYTIKLHPPDYFLGCNVAPGDSPSKLNISMKAYVTQLASKYATCLGRSTCTWCTPRRRLRRSSRLTRLPCG